MSNKRIDQLTLKSSIVAADLIIIADTEDIDVSGNPTTKKVTYDTFVNSNTFLLLTDTPSSFSSQAGKIAAVNTGETALEFVDPTLQVSTGKIIQFDDTNSLQLGTGTTASGTNSTTLGNGNTASGINSLAFGTDSIARYHSSVATASGSFISAGDAQKENLVVYCQTTDATPTVMYTNTTTTYPLTIVASAVISYEIDIFAVQIGGASGTVGDTWKYNLSGILRRNSGSTSFAIESYKNIIRNEDDVNFDVEFYVNDTLDSMEVKVTGAANKEINWIADIRLLELST